MRFGRELNDKTSNTNKENRRSIERVPSTLESSDPSLRDAYFSTSVSKDSLRWTRPFTKLVGHIPYLGDVVIYRGLNGIYTAQDKDSLSKAMDAFQSRILFLTIIHVGMAASIGLELCQDVGKLSKGSVEKIPEIAFESSLLTVLSAVTASQLILYRRMKNRVDHLKEREERLSVSKAPRPSNRSIVLGLLLFLGSMNTFTRTIDSERPTPKKDQNTEVKKVGNSSK